MRLIAAVGAFFIGFIGNIIRLKEGRIEQDQQDEIHKMIYNRTN